MSVSFVIPTFNRGTLVEEAAAAALSEAAAVGGEVVVVDDGSTDDTAERLAALPLRYVQTGNRGVSARAIAASPRLEIRSSASSIRTIFRCPAEPGRWSRRSARPRSRSAFAASSSATGSNRLRTTDSQAGPRGR